MRTKFVLPALGAALLASPVAHASFLSGEALDTAANALAWFVLIVMPVAVIVLFLILHVMPEKIAEKRHHPHKDSIKTLCILSLFFGGMLWPIAWLWAYTRPVVHRAVYGTEKHDDYFVEMGEKARLGELTDAERIELRRELAAMASRQELAPRLRELLEELHVIRTPEEAAANAAKRVPEPAAGGQG